jgi:pimeloyl-ACP methyl ester carboxylesterase
VTRQCQVSPSSSYPHRVVLVAQSLAGFTAPLVCQQVPVALVVLLNAMIPRPGERPGEWWTNTRHDAARRQQNRRDGRAANAPFDPLTDFFHDVPQPVIDEAWAQGEPRQSDTVFASPCSFETWPAVPTRVLIGRDDRFFPADCQRRVARERLGISADEMQGGISLRSVSPRNWQNDWTYTQPMCVPPDQQAQSILSVSAAGRS